MKKQIKFRPKPENRLKLDGPIYAKATQHSIELRKRVYKFVQKLQELSMQEGR